MKSCEWQKCPGKKCHPVLQLLVLIAVFLFASVTVRADHKVNVLIVSSRVNHVSRELAKDVEDAFMRNKLPEYGTSVRTLYYDSEKSGQDIRNKLQKSIYNAFGKSTKDDVNVFYYTGHTVHDKEKTVYGIPLEKDDSLSYKYLASDLARRGGKYIVIMDTCYAGQFYEQGIKKLDPKIQQRFTCMLCNVKDSKTYGASYTKALLSGIGYSNSYKSMEADKNRDGIVTVSEAHEYAIRNAKHWLLPNNKYIALTGNKGDFPLFQHAYPKIQSSSVKLNLDNKKTFLLNLSLNRNVKGVKREIVWSSSDENVVNVSVKKSSGDGIHSITLQAKNAGSATVSAYLNSRWGKCTATKVTCKVTVEDGPLKVKPDSMTLVEGESKPIKAILNGKTKNAAWTSSNRAVATVSSNGKVFAKKQGQATITAKIGKKKASCAVMVKPFVIKVMPADVTMKTGETRQLKATANSSAVKLTWTSSDTSVVKVDSKGKITAQNKAGTAVVTVSGGGKKARCKVTVTGGMRFKKVVMSDKSTDHLYFITDQGALWYTKYGEVPVKEMEGVIDAVRFDIQGGTPYCDVIKSDHSMWRKNLLSGSDFSKVDENVKQTCYGFVLKTNGDLYVGEYLISGNIKSISSQYDYYVHPVSMDHNLLRYSLEYRNGEYGYETRSIMSNVDSCAEGFAMLVLKLDGTVWKLTNYGGYIEDMETEKIMDNVKTISTSPSHAVFLKKDGSVWVMGDNSSGQCGTGIAVDRYDTPVKIKSNGDDFIYAEAGFYRTALIREDGTLWMCGAALPFVSSADRRSTPVQITW